MNAAKAIGTAESFALQQHPQYYFMNPQAALLPDGNYKVSAEMMWQLSAHRLGMNVEVEVSSRRGVIGFKTWERH